MKSKYERGSDIVLDGKKKRVAPLMRDLDDLWMFKSTFSCASEGFFFQCLTRQIE